MIEIDKINLKLNKNQVFYILDLWKSDFISKNITSNTNKYYKMIQEFNTTFNTNILEIQIKNNIRRHFLF